MDSNSVHRLQFADDAEREGAHARNKGFVAGPRDHDAARMLMANNNFPFVKFPKRIRERYFFKDSHFGGKKKKLSTKKKKN